MGEVPHTRWSHMRIATSRLLIKAARKLDPPKPASFNITSAFSLNAAQEISRAGREGGARFASVIAAEERLASARRRAQRPLHPEPL